MPKSEKEKCRCPYKDCKRNGKCDECIAYHNGDTYCKKNPQKK